MITEPFEFRHHDQTLRGVIAWPDDRQPVAGIIQTFGHGRTNVRERAGRDEFHRAMTDAGVVLCAWDRAGCGGSDGEYDHHQSPQDSGREAAAAAREFSRRTGMPFERIGYCGASRAGWINGYAIDELGAAAFWISVVPGGDHDNFPYLLRTNLRLEGHGDEEIALVMASFDAAERVLAEGGTYAEYRATLADFVANPFGQFLAGQLLTDEAFPAEQRRRQAQAAGGGFVSDFGSVLERVACPVLAMFGGRDSQVDWRDSRRLYERHVRNLRVHVFPEANHAFQRCTTGSFREMCTGQTHGDYHAESAAVQIGWLRELGFATPLLRRRDEPRPAMISELRKVDLTFPSGPDTLAGTLTLPVGVPGPYPVVAFVHGSGGINRVGSWNGQATGMYCALFEAFAAEGFASFAWDKPGVGQSTGDWRKQSITGDRADEVSAALTAVAARPEIDASRMGLWGISQAGWVIPAAAVADARVAFAIIVSGPGGTAAEQDCFRVMNAVRAAGHAGAAAERAAAFLRRRSELVRAGALAEVKALQTGARAEPWFDAVEMWDEPMDFLHRNLAVTPVPFLARMRTPLLALWGDADTLVDIAEARAVYETELRRAGNPDFTLHTYAAADHCLAPTADASREGGSDFVKGCVAMKRAWLRERFARPRSPAPLKK